MVFDLVIRNGTVVDGSGQVGSIADVAVSGERIVAVGRVDGQGAREIDADGLLVTPGFIDIHTHYDGQATWDDDLAPTSRHGVTTTMFGNCGVGFAPVRPKTEQYLIELMEGVEDIPGTVLAEGIEFSWESFPQYLDALGARHYAIDVCAMVPHSPLRFYVMGPRGADHTAEPTDAEIEEMGRLAAEGVAAGAFGFSTSRTRNHKTLDGRFIPTLTSSARELQGIATALRRLDQGVLQAVSDFIDPQIADIDTEFALLRSLAELSGRPLSISLLQLDHEPDAWRRILELMETAAREGVDVRAQVAARAVGILCGLQATTNPFGSKPSYREIANLPLEERVAELRRPERRAAILAEEPGAHRFTRMVHDSMHRLFELGEVPDYEPDPSTSLAAQAARLGVPAHELAYDVMLRRGGRELLHFPMNNYAAGNLDVVAEMLQHERALPGLSDGGAHAGALCDASFPTFLLSHWSRDRTRGERLPLEFMVRAQTHATASFVGLHDRGLIREGYRADLNVIDFDRLRAEPPAIVHDLPSGGRRLMQRAVGYRHTFCAGVETITDDEFTGARPGRLVRGARPHPGSSPRGSVSAPS